MNTLEDFNKHEWANSIARPQAFTQSLKLRDKLLMIPGPTNIHPRVLRAMAIPIISHTDIQLYKLLAEIQNGIRYLMQTKNIWTFALTGAGTCAMETSICNLCIRGERLLSLVHGHWGERVASMGERLGLDVVRLHPSVVGDVFSLQQIEDGLRTYRPKLMYVCHGDSSLGLLQPLSGIGKLCGKYECLLVVDAVVSLCSAPIAMDSLEIDVLFSAGQKALSGPPGISLISLNEKAVRKLKARPKSQPVASYYNDLTLVAKSWGIENEGKYAYHYTHAISLLYGLREAIALVVEEGLENVVHRHNRIKSLLETKLSAENLHFLISRSQHRLPGIMSVLIPSDIDGGQVMDYLYEKHNILIGGSLLAANFQLPKFWRLGYLGMNAEESKIDKLCVALKDALQQQRTLKSRL